MTVGLMERPPWKREAVGWSLTEQPRRLGCRADRQPGQTVGLEGNLLRLEEKNHVSIRVPGGRTHNGANHPIPHRQDMEGDRHWLGCRGTDP